MRRAVFGEKSALFGCESAEYSMGCCIAQVPFRQVGLLQILLREVLDIHYLVQADGEPLSPDFPKFPRHSFRTVWQVDVGRSVRSVPRAYTREDRIREIFSVFPSEADFPEKHLPISFREFSGPVRNQSKAVSAAMIGRAAVQKMEGRAGGCYHMDRDGRLPSLVSSQLEFSRIRVKFGYLLNHY